MYFLCRELSTWDLWRDFIQTPYDISTMEEVPWAQAGVFFGFFCVQVSFTAHLSTYFLHDTPRIMMSDWVWFLSVIDKGKGGGPGGILWECGPARLFAFSRINVGSSSRKKGRKGHLANRQLRAGPGSSKYSEPRMDCPRQCRFLGMLGLLILK